MPLHQTNFRIAGSLEKSSVRTGVEPRTFRSRASSVNLWATTTALPVGTNFLLQTWWRPVDILKARQGLPEKLNQFGITSTFNSSKLVPTLVCDEMKLLKAAIRVKRSRFIWIHSMLSVRNNKAVWILVVISHLLQLSHQQQLPTQKCKLEKTRLESREGKKTYSDFHSENCHWAQISPPVKKTQRLQSHWNFEPAAKS